jgi:cytidine deaminase
MTNKNPLHKALINEAQKAMKCAYAPYSKFSVGAAILDENNNIHAGCNVENAAYPLGTCAEGSAISNMIISGGKSIKKIMLVSSGEQLVTPCGGCRQKIKEFSDSKTEIIVFHDNKTTKFSMEDLLPQSFSKEFLGQ